MNYRYLDTKEIDRDFFENCTENDKKIMNMIFNIAGSDNLLIQKIECKKNHFYFYIIRDNKGNYLVSDNRSNCIRFSDTKNINRWIDINDFLEGTIIL